MNEYSSEMKTFCLIFYYCRFKLIKWWAQSFLVGIPKIVCGYRDDDGVVHRLEEMDVQTLPDLAKVRNAVNVAGRLLKISIGPIDDHSNISS